MFPSQVFPGELIRPGNASTAGVCEHKKTIWRNLVSIQIEAISLVPPMRSKELLLVQENRTTVKTYSKSRIELRNLQILKKMLEK